MTGLTNFECSLSLWLLLQTILEALMILLLELTV